MPVFNTVKEAMEATHANATVIFVPAKYTAAGVYEACDAGVPLIMTIARACARTRHDDVLRRSPVRKGSGLFGPNSFGIISPGKSKAGFMAHKIFTQGGVGLMTRSATYGYETAFRLTELGIGISTAVGVGGDMIPGSTFVDLLPDFEADPETKAIVMIGEIGGSEEELAAAYLKKHGTQGQWSPSSRARTRPKGKSMGHAGAIVSADGTGSAQNKESALRAAGAYIAESTFSNRRTFSGNLRIPLRRRAVRLLVTLRRRTLTPGRPGGSVRGLEVRRRASNTVCARVRCSRMRCRGQGVAIPAGDGLVYAVMIL